MSLAFKEAAVQLETKGKNIAEKNLMEQSTKDKDKRFKRLIAVELDQRMFDELNKEKADLARDKRWMRFDTFCTFIVCVNAVFIGAEANGDINGDDNPAEDFFLAFFIIEYGVRFCSGWLRTVQSMWCWLDLTVIAIGLIKPIGSLSGGDGSSGVEKASILRLFRVLRLLRLLRLVKLVHFFRELMLLVASVVSAAKSLVWSVVLLVIAVYIFAVVMTDNMTEEKLALNPKFQNWWGHLSRSMVTLFQLATNDSFGEIVSETSEGNVLIWAVLMIFWTFSFLGVLNLVVGAMVYAAMGAAEQQQKYANMSVLLHQQEKLLSLWQRLRGCGMRPVFDDPTTIRVEELRKELQDEGMAKVVAAMGVTKDDLQATRSACMKASGILDIDGFIEGLVRFHGSLQPADVWSWYAHLEVMTKECRLLSGGVTRICALQHGVQKQVVSRLDSIKEKASDMAFAFKPTVRQKEDTQVKKTELALRRYDAEEQNVKQDARMHQKEMMWGVFDSSFGIFVVLQGVMSGIRLTDLGRANAGLLETGELILLIIFSAEIGIRFRLFREIAKRNGEPSIQVIWKGASLGEDDHVAETVPSVGLHILYFFNDGFLVFDIIIIALGWVDVCMAGSGWSGSWLRIIRIVRITRILRIFRLFRELWLLLSAVSMSIDTLCWVLAVLFLFVYVAANAIMSFLKFEGKFDEENENFDPIVYAWFGSLTRSMLTLFQIASFDGWTDIVRYFYDEPAVFWTLMFFIVAARLDVLNFLVGMMCHCAHTVVENETKTKFRSEVANIRVKLEQKSAQKLKNQAMNAGKFLSVEESVQFAAHEDEEKRAEAVAEHEGEHSLTEREVSEFFGDPSVAKAAQRVGLSKSDALSVFSKLDPGQMGSVPTDAFIDGCVRMNTDVEGDDVFVIKITARQCEMEMVEISMLCDALVAEVELMLQHLGKISEIMAVRKEEAQRGMQTVHDGEKVPQTDTVKALKEIQTRALDSYHSMKEMQKRVDMDDDDDDFYKSTVFEAQKSEDVEAMQFTPRSAWQFFEWNAARERVEKATAEMTLDKQIAKLTSDVAFLDKELSKKKLRENQEQQERKRKDQEKQQAEKNAKDKAG